MNVYVWFIAKTNVGHEWKFHKCKKHKNVYAYESHKSATRNTRSIKEQSDAGRWRFISLSWYMTRPWWMVYHWLAMNNQNQPTHTPYTLWCVWELFAYKTRKWIWFNIIYIYDIERVFNVIHGYTISLRMHVIKTCRTWESIVRTRVVHIVSGLLDDIQPHWRYMAKKWNEWYCT